MICRVCLGALGRSKLFCFKVIETARSDLSELEISSGASLEVLQGKGIDALLVVKMAAGDDGLPQSASVRLTNTRTQQVIAAIS